MLHCKSAISAKARKFATLKEPCSDKQNFKLVLNLTVLSQKFEFILCICLDIRHWKVDTETV